MDGTEVYTTSELDHDDQLDEQGLTWLQHFRSHWVSFQAQLVAKDASLHDNKRPDVP